MGLQVCHEFSVAQRQLVFLPGDGVAALEESGKVVVGVKLALGDQPWLNGFRELDQRELPEFLYQSD
jgi:hypothetical protein